jgi:hypothetical protein
MNAVAETRPQVSCLSIAALLLAARGEQIRLGLPHLRSEEILEATGAGRSRAYELAAMIPEAVAGLQRPPGRPPAAPSTPPAVTDLSRPVLAYLMDHPGSVSGRGHRRSYSTGFRCFILDLIEDHPTQDLGAVASSTAVPLPTLRDWMRAGRPKTEPSDEPTAAPDEISAARFETVLHEWEHWEGEFVPFCDHLREDLHLPYGRTLISGILEELGARSPRRRPGRSPDEEALRQSFETFFPGAQWQGDGSPIKVRLGSRTFEFNLELVVDTHTDAVIGISVRDSEDSQAVIEAFGQSVETAGSTPLVLELDNRPSNHCDEVGQAVGDTIVMPSTPGRPQSNGYVEGGHSLFQNAAPKLVIESSNPKDEARRILELIVTVWARTLNLRPRPNRGNRSRAHQYREETPTPEQLRQARERLRERCRRQERARETQRARRDPVVIATLDRAFERLGLDDPKGHVRAAIARYPLDHILAGIAVYEGKRKASTLPQDVDARYLLGIIRNVSNKDEGLIITEELIRLRLEARDLMLAHLVQAREQLRATTTDPDELLRSTIKCAMDARRSLDRIFWIDSAAELIAARPETEQTELLRMASRRIHSYFAVPYRERLEAVRLLARKVITLE